MFDSKVEFKLILISVVLILGGGVLTALAAKFLLVVGIVLVVMGALLFIFTYWLY